MFRDLDHLADHTVQAVDETVDPAPHVATLIALHGAAVDPLAQIALAFGQRTNHLGHLLHARSQPSRPEGRERPGPQQEQQTVDQMQRGGGQTAELLQQTADGEQRGHREQIGLHQPDAQRTATIDLLQIRLAHHPPTVWRALQLEGNALADDRNVSVVRVAGIGDEQVGTLGDRLPHTRMQLAGGRIGKTQFQLGMLLHAHRSPARVHTAFQVLAVAEGGIFEARA